jgi:hypothetical protein
MSEVIIEKVIEKSGQPILLCSSAGYHNVILHNFKLFLKMFPNVSGLSEEAADSFLNPVAPFFRTFPGVFPVPLTGVSVPPSLSGVR